MTTIDPTPTVSEPGADSTDQLWRWSAAEMAQAVAGGVGLQSRGRGELSGADRQVNPQLNALVEVNDSLDQAADYLRDVGYVVEEIELPVLAAAYWLWHLLCIEEFRLAMPMVNEVGDQGMQKAAEHYYAVAAEWWEGRSRRLNSSSPVTPGGAR